jgi:uncharacterized lipoprotein YmbA
MNTARRIFTASLIVLAAAHLTACGSLDKSYPDKSLYGIDAGQPPIPTNDDPPTRVTPTSATNVSRAQVLLVRRVSISPPFDDLSLTYRDRDGKYVKDYYSNWVAPPDELLSSQLIAWLSASGPFQSVVDGRSAAPHRFALETCITSLYGDFQNPHAPKVVLHSRVFLIDESAGARSIAYQTHYEIAINIPAASAEQLVAGSSLAYRQMLQSLDRDLSTFSQATASGE